jgi:hypothetical protein
VGAVMVDTGMNVDVARSLRLFLQSYLGLSIELRRRRTACLGV